MRAAAHLLEERIGGRAPRVALILGSGLGGIVRHLVDAVEVPFAEIPGFPEPTVAGHPGRLAVGTLDGVEVLAIAGRLHLYEGHSPGLCTLPVRAAYALGARTLFISNAAGGIRRTFRSGDLMLIRDHVNLTWRNPLIGPAHDGEPRFPDMSQPYDSELLALLRDSALHTGVPVVEGVYAGVLGPSYETPAEIRMLERLGADAVGMSTIPEVLVARALGMRVAAMSCITNPAAGIASGPLDHASVLRVAAQSREHFERVVREFVRAWEVGGT